MTVISSSAQGSLANKSCSYIIKDYYLYVIYECTYLGEQFSKTFVTLQINGKLHSCIKVHVNNFINDVINMITMHLLFMKYVCNLHT